MAVVWFVGAFISRASIYEMVQFMSLGAMALYLSLFFLKEVADL